MVNYSNINPHHEVNDEWIFYELKKHEKEEYISILNKISHEETSTLTLLRPVYDYSYNHNVRYWLLRGKNTSADALLKLSEVKYNHQRLLVACHPNTSSFTLYVLSKDKDYHVRKAVACNPNTSTETLASLAISKYVYIRASVAINPNTPANILKKLRKDKSKIVRKTAKNRMGANRE